MTTNSTNKYIIGIALSVVIIIAAYFTLGSDKQSDSFTEYGSYLTTYQTEQLDKYAIRGGGDKGKTLRDTINLGLHESINGSSEKALEIFRQLYQQHPDNEDITLNLGIQLFKMEKYTEAVNLLTPLLLSSKKEVREEAEMTVAMAATAFEDNGVTAKKWLQKIANSPDHMHQDLAQIQLEFYN